MTVKSCHLTIRIACRVLPSRCCLHGVVHLSSGLTFVTRSFVKPRASRQKQCCLASSEEPSNGTPQTSQRLFSNLNPETLKHEPGSVWGAAALVAGTTVGAGILALPAVTAESGFLASSVALVATYVFSVATGLLLAEVNINTMCELGGSGVSINSMARRTIGEAGTGVSVVSYVGLQYALLVAYTAKGGELVSKAIGGPPAISSVAFVVVLSTLCYALSPRTLDAVNTLLVVAVVGSFLVLLGGAAGDVDPTALLRADWSKIPNALPVIALAFVYQNVVPSIASSLEGDIVKVRQAVCVGCFLPLIMFVAWDGVILGTAGMATGTLAGEATQSSGGIIDPVAMLQYSAPALGPWIDAFSFFAIATSFIGFVLGLTAFYSDALQLPLSSANPMPYALTVVPPLLLAVTYPNVFFQALDFAGTYGVLILFGLVPVAMAWSERYMGSTLTRFEVVPGGRVTLLLVGAVAAAVIATSAVQDIAALAQ